MEERQRDRERGTKGRGGSVLYKALRAFTMSDLFISFGKNFGSEIKITQISLAMWSLPLWDTHGLANERAFLVFLKILMFCLAHIFWYFHFLILSYNVIYLDVLDLVPFNISYSREVLSYYSPILTQEIVSEVLLPASLVAGKVYKCPITCPPPLCHIL